MRFEDRVAIVTGAARGIGLAIAERLAAEGARVVLVDVTTDLGRQAEAGMREAGLDATFMQADITSRPEVEATGDRVFREFGRIDVLVNNAALFNPMAFFDVTEHDLAQVLEVNICGTFSVTQAVARRMVQAGRGGAIVNMSSITAAQGAPSLLAYSASKGAVSAMTRSMAIALAEHGIRVNAVAPGMISTEATSDIGERDPDLYRLVLTRTPLRRLGEPREIAAVVAFMASDDAAYLTGQVVYPDGGRLALSYTVPVNEK
jgi:NAD(P)-dependent dehydrogenase (short-subunit alcohol dehydrogenase family)